MSTILVDIQHITKHYPLSRGLFARADGHVTAVDDVSFPLFRGEILGLVGESGCGKSTLGRIILNLLRPTRGRVLFEGVDIEDLNRAQMMHFRKKAQIVFQDPDASLNPRMSVGTMLREALLLHGIVPPAEVQERIGQLLETVGLNAFHARRYPHEFSSGQRQRICIARALAVQPVFIVCDEPVSSLDVSIQAQILNLLMDLQQLFHLAYLFISHDLSVVRHISDRIAVMYLGKIVELGTAAEVHGTPRHPYTSALINATAVPDPSLRRERVVLRGDVPSPAAVPPGCAFHPRCPRVFDDCLTVVPRLATLPDGHMVRCLLFDVCRPDEATSSPSAAHVTAA